MHSFVQIDDWSWVHTSRVRAFDTDKDGFLSRVWLDGEQGSRSVTKRYLALDGVQVGPCQEWPFLEPKAEASTEPAKEMAP